MLHRERVPSAPLAAVFGLLTALCFGVGSFTAQRLTARVGWLRAALLVHAVALPVMAAVALAIDGPPRGDAAALSPALGLGLLNVLSLVTLYRAFAVGALSIVAPIASSYAAVTVGLSALTGEAPSAPTLVGLVAVVVGVAAIAAAHGAASRPGDPPRAAGVGWAVLSSLCLGAELAWIEPVTAALGPLWPVFLMRALGTALLWPLRRLLRPPEPARTSLPWAWICACVLVDSLGLVLYAHGTAHGSAAVVAVLASLSTVVTLGLARRRLHERLSATQWGGVLLLLVGTARISYRAQIE